MEHTILEWVGSLLGSASVPALVAAAVWKFRAQIIAWIEKQIAGRLDRVVQNTALGQQIAAIPAVLGVAPDTPPPPLVTPVIPMTTAAPPSPPTPTGS